MLRSFKLREHRVICDVLGDLLLFVQFEGRGEHLWGMLLLVGLQAKSLCVSEMPAQDRALVFDFDFDFGRVIKSHKISSIQSGTMASCLWRIYNSKYKLKD